MNDTTKAAVYRWFDANAGRTIDTRQVLANGRTWSPGPRPMVKSGAKAWMLNGSEFRLSDTHRVVEVTDEHVIVTWHYEDGTLIHTTTYTVMQDVCPECERSDDCECEVGIR